MAGHARRRAPDKRAEVFRSLEERIRDADSKSPAELALLAKEVEENMQDLDDVVPEIREMLLRRQRAMASKDTPVPPRTPEAVTAEQVKLVPVFRKCACGCGVMLACGSTTDAGIEETHKTQLIDPCPPPPVNASAQRAYCEMLCRPQKKSPKSQDVTPTAAAQPKRMPNFGRLHEMAVPREKPPPPEPEPPFRALPAPRTKILKPSFSAPDLQRIPTPPACSSSCQSTLGLRARDSLRQQSAHAPTFEGGAAGVGSTITELRCHAMKSKCFMLPLAGCSQPLLPPLGQDFADDLSYERAPEAKRHVSASEQRRYVQKNLYRGHENGVPGSSANLQARLDALRKENKARDKVLEREERELEARQEKSRKRHGRSKHSHHCGYPTEFAAEMIC